MSRAIRPGPAPTRPALPARPAALRFGRRGSTSAAVAVALTVLVGSTALAVDAVRWYLARRNATTAADLAALAGSAAWEAGRDPVASGASVAARNGFAQGGGTSVVVNAPPRSGTYASVAGAVEVLVSQPQAKSLAAVIMAGAPTIRSRAVATATTDEEVCLLALGGGLELGGNSTVNARRCALASNAAAPGGISVVGSARVRAAMLTTTGTCSGCASGDVWTDDTRTQRPTTIGSRPVPITDPFASLRSWTPSPPSGCANLSFQSRRLTLSPGQSICSSLTVGPNETLTLQPGIYYLRNADLTVQGRIDGNGVTMVLTGDPDRVGTIRINAQSTGTLRGPASSLIPGHPEAAGLVLYRDARATNNGPQKEVQLNGGSTMDIIGGVYLPTSDVVVNGNSAMGSTCFAIIGYRLSLSGSSDTMVDVSGCAGFTPYPRIRTVRLVE
ncbi:pilus assembly protein TadG-related protein [Roseomonas sp. CCTCC AB2023176]|uniref:pilus assembly protein TadG-related protein n=1 Tax=Roseomonas sp. CCTCC AB2023176 TaxID=3342640 RepID=UPI0035E062C5